MNPTNRLRIGLLSILLAAAPLAFADQVSEQHQYCAGTTQQQARGLADVLFEQRDYQRAGECYEAAREYALANQAFLKAVGPQSAVTARQVSDQRDQAKALFHHMQQAFRVDH